MNRRKKEKEGEQDREGYEMVRMRRSDWKKRQLNSGTWAISTRELSNENQCEQCPGRD